MILVLASLSLVVLAVTLFVWSVRQGTYEHADRLVLLPIFHEDMVEIDMETEQK